MAAPVASYVQLPTDTSNTGKKNRTHTKVVGTDTVHEHFVVPTYQYTRIGRYTAASTATQNLSTAAQTGTGSGFYWLHMSTGSTATGILRQIDVAWSQSSTAVAAVSAPIISFQKFTYNTAFSGTTLNQVSYVTSSGGAQANIRSTSSGATITLVGQVAAFPVPAIATTVGAYGGYATIYNQAGMNRDDCVEFGPGEGIVCFQLSSGAATDTRQITCRFVWDEASTA